MSRDSVPYVPGSDTSEAAAHSMASAAPTIERRILDVYQTIGDDGARCEEIEDLFGMSHQTVSARITGLRHKGHLVDTGRRGVNRSGRTAAVWKAAK